jgi:osmotically-inducible protein OsmY
MESRPDRDIQRNVESELFACPDVDETDIAVKVTNGTVTLSGYARSCVDKYGAEDAVKRVRGVSAVANDIQVRPRFPTSVPDPQIARAAVAAIRRVLPEADGRVITLVRAGVVRLEGTLALSRQRDCVERAVREVRGVGTVINDITLGQAARSEDKQ